MGRFTTVKDDILKNIQRKKTTRFLVETASVARLSTVAIPLSFYF